LDVEEVSIVTNTTPPIQQAIRVSSVNVATERADTKALEIKLEREYPKLAKEYQAYLDALSGVIEPFSGTKDLVFQGLMYESVSDFAEASLEGVVDSAL
jgi:hypothetical protein